MNGMTNLDMEGIVIRYVGLAESPRNTQSGSLHTVHAHQTLWITGSLWEGSSRRLTGTASLEKREGNRFLFPPGKLGKVDPLQARIWETRFICIPVDLIQSLQESCTQVPRTVDLHCWTCYKAGGNVACWRIPLNCRVF